MIDQAGLDPEFTPGDDPPLVPPPELPREELQALVDAGDLQQVERALREHTLRLPLVLEELNRVVDQGLGNLATSLLTMLVSHFKIARVSALVDKVLGEKNTAGAEELTDLGLALFSQERLNAAEKAADAALSRNKSLDHALYLKARLLARRGYIKQAFFYIRNASPKFLGARGLSTQARYAAFSGHGKSVKAVLQLAKKNAAESDLPDVAHTERILERMRLMGAEEASPTSLREAMAIEYGSLVVELAKEQNGRFGLDPLSYGDAGLLINRIADTLRLLGTEISEFLYASEDGEIVATALSQKLGVECRGFAAEISLSPGAWLCMGSANTHPHIANKHVQALQAALDQGKLSVLSLVLPWGWRGPLVPDVIGRISGDDEFAWDIDTEVEDAIEEMESSPPTSEARKDWDTLTAHIERYQSIFRATQPPPRAPLVPYFDETPIPPT